MRLLHYSDIENVHDDPESVGRLAGTIQSATDDGTLVCGTGDDIAPGVMPLVSRGEIALLFFEAIRPRFETFGNHDFDFGVERTADLVDRSPQQWLSANVLTDDGQFAGVDRWTIERIDGSRIGFFGLTDPTTPPAEARENGVTFADPIPAAHRAVEALRDRDVEYVVALSHLGQGDDRLAAACDVDIILGGHVHTERIERIGETLLTRPGSGGKTVFEIDVESRTVTRHVAKEGPLDAALASAYRKRIEDAGLDTIVAHVEESIERSDRSAYRGESRIGNFVTDAYRWAAERVLGTEPPVVGLQNSGGIRTGAPLSGPVTKRDLIGIVPFDDAVVVVELTGEQLRSVFREGADTPGFGEPDWWHAHVSGANLVYDHTEDLLLEAIVAGQPVDPESSYRLAVSEFLLGTEIEFPTLNDASVLERLDAQYNILINYAREIGINPDLEGRIVRKRR